VSDEIYHGLSYAGRDRTVLEFTDRAFVLNGFSKAYAMTGWRLGWVIGPREHIRALQTLYGNFFISTNEFVQWAGVAALREAGADSRRFRAIFDDRRRAMIAGLRGIGLGVGAEPTGAFYVLANARHLSRDSVSLAREILESSHVAVTPGAAFGANAEGYLRFSYASSLERIREGLSRLERFLAAPRVRESRDAKRARARQIVRALKKAYPDAKCALNFTSPLELLVATILSAQCTDERVNMVTPGPLQEIPDRARLRRSRHRRPRGRTVRSTGFYRAKSRSIVGMAKALIDRHGGEVPKDREALTELPGVGLKTANVLLGNAFGEQAVAVDTHVFRVSQRLGLARSDDPDKIHDQLVDVLPKAELTLTTHLLQSHGRRCCAAKKPLCPACPVKSLCPLAR
jgi:endonuclease III